VRADASAGYFEDLATPSCLDFAATYARRFGPDAPVLNSLGESCYEGVRLLTALMRRAGSVEVLPMTSVAEGLSYESPRGTVELRNRHLRQRVFLAAADGPDLGRHPAALNVRQRPTVDRHIVPE
jgi:hypothetical protein